VPGVHRLLRRIMTYATLGELGIHLTVDQFAEASIELTASGHAQVTGHEGAAAWFAGIRRGTCIFGVDREGLDDPPDLAGTLAHEVAHAYRRFHDLEEQPTEVEERLTDLTTVFLGFGILTTNAALRFSSGSAGDRSYWRTRRGGYLSPQAMSFLLGAWAVVRFPDRKDRKRIARALETNQAACFQAACEHLEREALIARLGLPLPSLWPAVRPRPEVTFEDVELAEVDDESDDELADDHPTFRVEVSRVKPLWVLLGLLGGFVAVLALIIRVSTLLGIAAAGATALFVSRLGPKNRWDQCADPGCGHHLAPGDEICPGCRRQIAGRIAHASMRLEAAEEIERSGRR
jgi:hypothetical protein